MTHDVVAFPIASAMRPLGATHACNWTSGGGVPAAASGEEAEAAAAAETEAEVQGSQIVFLGGGLCPV